ncbi:MAG: acyl-CoA dehydrogenase [Gammaproteobacteria bacterium]|nr:acyl-CoA dehydrogenase [Gammaproteobacteria bacterium]
MSKRTWTLWDWPFFNVSHHELATRASAFAREAAGFGRGSLSERSRGIATALARAGLLDFVLPDSFESFDVRALCVIREALTYEDALLDAIFTMQGIGTVPIQRFGTDNQKARYLPRARAGTSVAAFALTEPEAGSDAASVATTATRADDGYVLNGEKTLISNAQFADHFIVVARTGEAPGARGLSAFVIDADVPGLTVGEPIEFIAEHPAASVSFSGCRVPDTALIGAAGQGFKVAMGAFDLFRPSVGAAAVGLARRALHETLERVTTRQLYSKPMSELQSVQMMLADMAADLDTAALAVYRAAWEWDVGRKRSSYAPSMAKLVAAEAAGRVVDRAVQLCGGVGVTRGSAIEKLYREARPMRIYEGASEVQKLIVARQLLENWAARPR